MSSVRIEGWDSYRIDRTYRTPRQRARRERRDNEWLTVAFDGRQTYQVYSDRVHIGPSAPPPAELTDLADGSWLLRCHLSGGSAIVAGDRRASASLSPAPGPPPLMMSSAPASRAGRRVRAAAAAYLLQRRKPVARCELRDITPGDGSGAAFEIPPGLRIVDESSGDDRPPPPPPVNLVTSVAKAAADVIKRRADDKSARRTWL